MKQTYLIIAFYILEIFNSFGQLTVEGGVKYQRKDGSFSEYYFRDIDIITGVELNKATESKNYDTNADYAQIWYGQGEVATVKLNSQIQNNVDRVFGNKISKVTFDVYMQLYGYKLEGETDDGTKWKFCFYSEGLRMFCE